MAFAFSVSTTMPAITAETPPARQQPAKQTWKKSSCSVVASGRSASPARPAKALVGGADLAVRPMLRVAELLEAVPGMIAAQHSGSGKANQYFLRGFKLDHGTDFTTYVDDMPWNLRTHGHGQGYLDVNGLIPEVVDRIDYRKGPYRADIGDFALAGASFMSTIDRLRAAVRRRRRRASTAGAASPVVALDAAGRRRAHRHRAVEDL